MVRLLDFALKGSGVRFILAKYLLSCHKSFKGTFTECLEKEGWGGGCNLQCALVISHSGGKATFLVVSFC